MEENYILDKAEEKKSQEVINSTNEGNGKQSEHEKKQPPFVAYTFNGPNFFGQGAAIGPIGQYKSKTEQSQTIKNNIESVKKRKSIRGNIILICTITATIATVWGVINSSTKHESSNNKNTDYVATSSNTSKVASIQNNNYANILKAKKDYVITGHNAKNVTRNSIVSTNQELTESPQGGTTNTVVTAKQSHTSQELAKKIQEDKNGIAQNALDKD